MCTAHLHGISQLGGAQLELNNGVQMTGAPVVHGSKSAEATAALASLGYSQGEIGAALKGVDAEHLSVEEIVRLIAGHAVTELVLGYPKNMDGTVGPRAEKAAAFAETLRQAADLPVTLWDERRTTVDAHNILFNNGKRTSSTFCCRYSMTAVSPTPRAVP